MKSKAPLALMEQMVMLLVFALAAALCLQAFVKSDEISNTGAARDRAAVLCQSVAEVIRSVGGEPAHALSSAAKRLNCRYDQGLLWMDYDEDWNDGSEGVYRLTAQAIPSGVPGLRSVRVAVERDGELLFELNTAWQVEMSANGCRNEIFPANGGRRVAAGGVRGAVPDGICSVGLDHRTG